MVNYRACIYSRYCYNTIFTFGYGFSDGINQVATHPQMLEWLTRNVYAQSSIRINRAQRRINLMITLFITRLISFSAGFQSTDSCQQDCLHLPTLRGAAGKNVTGNLFAQKRGPCIRCKVHCVNSEVKLSSFRSICV